MLLTLPRLVTVLIRTCTETVSVPSACLYTTFSVLSKFVSKGRCEVHGQLPQTAAKDPGAMKHHVKVLIAQLGYLPYVAQCMDSRLHDPAFQALCDIWGGTPSVP